MASTCLSPDQIAVAESNFVVGLNANGSERKPNRCRLRIIIDDAKLTRVRETIGADGATHDDTQYRYRRVVYGRGMWTHTLPVQAGRVRLGDVDLPLPVQAGRVRLGDVDPHTTGTGG